MSLRLVRCPFCGKRFNIAGVAAGTRLKCSGCTAILLVPESGATDLPTVPFYRRFGFQGPLVLGALAVIAGIFYLRIRKEGVREDSKPVLAVVNHPTETAPKIKEPVERPNPPFLDWDSRVLDAKQKLIDEFGSNRVRFMADRRPFLIAVEQSERFSFDEVIKDYSTALDVLYQVFSLEFSGTLERTDVDEVLPVVVLNSRESYDSYNKRYNDGATHSPEIRGLYEYSRRRTVLYHDHWVPFEVILHEGVHQLVHYYTRQMGRGETTAYWFQEGMGTYFEGFRRKSATGEIVLDPGVNRLRLPAMKAALYDPNNLFIPLKTLVGMSIDEFWAWYRDLHEQQEVLATRRAQVFYAESWALLYFLRGPKYRRAFDEYFALELKGHGGKESFEKVIRSQFPNSDDPLTALEGEFKTFIQELR